MKTKGLALGAMPKNLKKKNEGIESGCNAGELEKKMKGSNLCAMLENPEQKEGIESGRDARKPDSKQRDQI